MSSLLARDANLQLTSANDALDIMSSGLPACILTTADLHPEFFNLKNGIAGECLQKFVNYDFRVAIVVADDHNYGQRVRELITDHQRHPCVRFFVSIAEAQAWLD